MEVKRSCVQFYLRLKRAEEECVLVKKEMNNVIIYWKDQINVLKEFVTDKDSGMKIV